jgi:Glyoxalase-like domain
MTVTAHLDLAVFEAADIEKVRSFYAELTGWDVVRNDSDRFGVRTPDGQEIESQRAPDPSRRGGPGRCTRSSSTSTCRSTIPRRRPGRAVGLGATGLADGPTWITLADPPVTRSMCAWPMAQAR